jgi:hypothetical protein
MPKFTLIAEHTNFTGETLQKNTLEFEEDYISAVLDNIKQFLQGTGFVIDGSLDIVPEDFGDPTGYESYEIAHPKGFDEPADYSVKQNFYKEVKIND